MLQESFGFRERPGIEAADLTRLHGFDDLSERVVVHWSVSSAGTRSWSQWWKQAKPIVELRHRPAEMPFPGYRDFSTTLDDVDTLPTAWGEVLRAHRGVYLLVCPEEGLQYVGSATGVDGFLGRWRNYAADGHGGNVHMRARDRRFNYRISILEVASSEMTPEEVIDRELHWMRKLGTRAHGLNHDRKGERLPL